MRDLPHKSHETPCLTEIIHALTWQLLTSNFSADYRKKWGADNASVEQIQHFYEDAVQFGA